MKISKWVYLLMGVLVILVVLYLALSGPKKLPPNDILGHVEEYPTEKVLTQPLEIPVFKHILEHTNTSGRRPGVIISYNCLDFDCEENLIGNLEAFTNDFDYVYVAPYPNMDVKIAITKYDETMILKEYDEETITKFIKEKIKI